MSFATMTRKGQITIPKAVRDATSLQAGDKLRFTVLEDGTILLRVKNRGIRDLLVKPRKGRHVTIEQMDC